MLKNYYTLMKPGIVYGNVFTTLAGFLFASRWHFNPVLLVATVVGIALVIASACVFNNYSDRDIDRKMERTKDRALATGAIPVRHALIFATVIGCVGVYLLFAYVNILTAAIALLGFILYVGPYGIFKRITHWATVVGSIPGAIPMVVGYTAVTDRLDSAALLLFLVLALWQMPHFYSIAIYRLDEYKKAGIPVLPARRGIRVTNVYIVFYIIAFLIAASMLTVLGYAGYTYLVCVLLFGFAWLWLGIQGFTAADSTRWARRLFRFSLIVLVAFSVALSIAPLLP